MRRASHRSQSPGRNINDADNSHTRRRTGILQLILTILRVPLSWLGAIFGRLIGVFLPQGDESGGLLEEPSSGAVANLASTIPDPPPQLSTTSYISTLVDSSNYVPTSAFTPETPPSPAPSLVLVVITSSIHPSHEAIKGVVPALQSPLSGCGGRCIVMDAVTSPEAMVLMDVFRIGKLPWAGVVCAVDLEGPLEGKVKGWGDGRPIDLVRQGALLSRINGLSPSINGMATQLTTLVNRTFAVHSPSLAAFASRRYENVMGRVLRASQDREFEETARQDREREEKKRKEKEDKEREQREKEESLKASIEKEALEREEKRNRIPPTPAAGTPGAVAIRFCLPSGAKFTRSFLSSTAIPIVKDFVDIHMLDNSVGITNYDLNVTYPRKKLQGERTLEEEGIGNGTVVMIIDNDA